jgi:hypothetical protein
MGYPLGNPPNFKKTQGLLHTSATILFWVRFAKHEGAIRPHDKNKPLKLPRPKNKCLETPFAPLGP